MIHVQHLLGIGHLQRSLLLAEALSALGLGVNLVSGGMPTGTQPSADIGFHQLPPARSPDASFSRLVDQYGNEVDDAWRLARRRCLLDLFDRLRPCALVTETFPFGRNMLRFELIPLLQAASRDSGCRQIICSIRDILQPKKRPSRHRQTVELIDRFYDRVLVHGDPDFARLEDSFGSVDAFATKIEYSGYIAPPGADDAVGSGDGEVLVSAGGSATGYDLLEAALEAIPLTPLADRVWRILVPPAIDDERYRSLCLKAGGRVIVERNRSDFATRLQHAACSVSQAGYNTVCNLLASNTAAVVVPFADAGELEQTLRARLLQKHARVAMLAASELTPSSLAAAIERALTQGPHRAANLDGARTSAALISDWIEAPGT